MRTNTEFMLAMKRMDSLGSMPLIAVNNNQRAAISAAYELMRKDLCEGHECVADAMIARGIDEVHYQKFLELYNEAQSEAA